MSQKVDLLEKLGGGDPDFYSFAKRLLHWRWHPADEREVASLVEPSRQSTVTAVVLPQGLIASGFFANLVLLDFDKTMGASIGTEVFPGAVLEDYCRYVDDIRVVLVVSDHDTDMTAIERLVAIWLQQTLDQTAVGLVVSPEKTVATTVSGDLRPIVRQSKRMRTIQQAVSGGFDAAGGEEILASIQGLLGTQTRHAARDDSGWSFAPVPDVRDATVARFAAGRYRSTFRSLRPLLENVQAAENDDSDTDDDPPISSGVSRSGGRTQTDLDDDAQAFALGLVDRWVEDPSNVRLLRIGLDLWPAPDVLRNVLSLLRPFTEKGGKRKAPRRVAWYCLAEIFRAGATETGFVADDESLPSGIDPDGYRAVLREEAHRLLALPAQRLPWYLSQQVLLFLSVSERDGALSLGRGTRAETTHYRDLIRYLHGESDRLTADEYAVIAILTRRSYRHSSTAASLAGRNLTPHRLEQIAQRDPSFAEELGGIGELGEESFSSQSSISSVPIQCELEDRLSELVSSSASDRGLRDELSLLSFASRAILAIANADMSTITPDQVLIRVSPADGMSREVTDVRIVRRDGRPESPFTPPDWCPLEQRWRFQLGYLLRYILTGAMDVTRAVRPQSWRESRAVYRIPESHWYQRVHGSFNGASNFGDDWLPISSWTEELLSALLAWPGMAKTEMMRSVDSGPGEMRTTIDSQIRTVKAKRGTSSGLLVIPLKSDWLAPVKNPRPLRGCVVQTVVPDISDFDGDLTLSRAAIRKKHRNHLSASMAAIDKMLALRSTHHVHRDRLDWLILPELAVHPFDVKTHLVPFARAHKTIILTGLTYQRLAPDLPLVNSAIWVIPQRTPTGGIDVIVRRQGKCHLAAVEHGFNAAAPAIRSFRPCQWVIEYEWGGPATPPLRLTAAICYDATDLALVSDMRDKSDVFAIPAFNRDVLTFDQMALALHYHMFQLVVVANNGL
jgi:hypothetical protein